MSYYAQPNSHIRDELKVVLELSKYATKKIEYATGIDTSNYAAKKLFIALKAVAEKLEINKLSNVPTIFNNLKT